ncbi:hypothetical protein B0T14DRAFT_601362 [Immersiella caudata]|uniref:Bacteriophage T5 Orf172 DNA-binding domain-containing protein n=1 Tax=Immersiella caudata TaxID=314043 RepID=A0AA40C2P9_9PEZI|nr:hypothetical protein B0T14DRAFT_601362 [Immersiella caudata]
MAGMAESDFLAASEPANAVEIAAGPFSASQPESTPFDFTFRSSHHGLTHHAYQWKPPGTRKPRLSPPKSPPRTSGSSLFGGTPAPQSNTLAALAEPSMECLPFPFPSRPSIFTFGASAFQSTTSTTSLSQSQGIFGASDFISTTSQVTLQTLDLSKPEKPQTKEPAIIISSIEVDSQEPELIDNLIDKDPDLPQDPSLTRSTANSPAEDATLDASLNESVLPSPPAGLRRSLRLSSKRAASYEESSPDPPVQPRATRRRTKTTTPPPTIITQSEPDGDSNVPINPEPKCPQDIDCLIEDRIRNPQPLRQRQPEQGYVYVVPAMHNGIRIVKIGVTGKTNPKKRLEEIESTCGRSGIRFLKRKHDHLNVLGYYYQVEALAHRELENFRYVFCCGCKKSREHVEYFVVEEGVGMRIVQRWADLCSLGAYTDPKGKLKEEWSIYLDSFWVKNHGRDKGGTEEWTDHERRGQRWKKWVEGERRDFLWRRAPELGWQFWSVALALGWFKTSGLSLLASVSLVLTLLLFWQSPSAMEWIWTLACLAGGGVAKVWNLMTRRRDISWTKAEDEKGVVGVGGSEHVKFPCS